MVDTDEESTRDIESCTPVETGPHTNKPMHRVSESHSGASEPTDGVITDEVAKRREDTPEPKPAKRQAEMNPTYQDSTHLERDLEVFLGRLHSVIRIVSVMFGLNHPERNDLANTVFLKTWAQPTRVPAERGQWTWLFKVASRTAISARRVNQRCVFTDPEGELGAEAPDNPPDISVKRIVHEKCVAQSRKFLVVIDVNLSLSELRSEKPLHVALLLLNAAEGYSVRDIEAMTDIGRTQVSEMIRSIKQEYRERYPDHAAYVA